MEEMFQTSDVTPGPNLIFSACSAPISAACLAMRQFNPALILHLNSCISSEVRTSYPWLAGGDERCEA